MNTRDSFGFAVKATYGELKYDNHGHPAVEAREIFKDPITDDGTKRSAKGLLQVVRVDGKLTLRNQATKEEEEQGELKVVFLDGKAFPDTLHNIRARLEAEFQSL